MRHVNEPMPLSIAHQPTVPLSLSQRHGGDVELMLNKLMERLPAAPAAASWSSEAYDRLLAGETVSWLQILQDHPLLGSITVTKLIEAGVVQASPALDARSAAHDVWLTLRSRANGEENRSTSIAKATGV